MARFNFELTILGWITAVVVITSLVKIVASDVLLIVLLILVILLLNELDSISLSSPLSLIFERSFES